MWHRPKLPINLLRAILIRDQYHCRSCHDNQWIDVYAFMKLPADRYQFNDGYLFTLCDGCAHERRTYLTMIRRNDLITAGSFNQETGEIYD
jgi:hypothetical protein